MYACKYCGKEWDTNLARSGHQTWCEDNPTTYDRRNTMSLKRKGILYRKKVLKTCHKLLCLKCGKQYEVTLTDYIFNKGKYKKHCSMACSNTHQYTIETRNKISNSLIKNAIQNPGPNSKIIIHCKYCNKEFKDVKQKLFCSFICFCQWRKCESNKTKTAKQIYAKQCKFKFKFNIYNYPQYFNLNLLIEYGLYKPLNRGNNLKGVSRDHMYSVTQGFRNNIDPKLISHPANCQLLIHTDNISKGTKCSLSLDQLKIKIKKFDKLYNNK